MRGRSQLQLILCEGREKAVHHVDERMFNISS